MLAHTKKPLIKDSIEIIVPGTPKRKFVIPRRMSPQLLKFLTSIQVNENDDELIPADEVFKDLDQKYGKVGVTIRGFRFRDEMTQVELAKKLNIRQSHVSQMEHGKRVIGKKLAQKLAKLFNTHYQLFL
ncbi:MAG: helix-turn-helix domain-containing protein [Candidatus Babeliales bacterium]